METALLHGIMERETHRDGHIEMDGDGDQGKDMKRGQGKDTQMDENTMNSVVSSNVNITISYGTHSVKLPGTVTVVKEVWDDFISRQEEMIGHGHGTASGQGWEDGDGKGTASGQGWGKGDGKGTASRENQLDEYRYSRPFGYAWGWGYGEGLGNGKADGREYYEFYK